MRLGLELELPQGEHRERMLDALAHLIRRRGFETFVAAPILLPQSDYFPERWERNVAGARRLIRRLMHYAALGGLRVSLESWRERPAALLALGLTTQHAGNHAAAWFAGIHDGTCDFGLELDQLRHEASLVATLGHEVAHAYRDHHGLVISDRELEEKLTDLTCVYLGFGLFTLNASHVVETGGIGPSGEKLLFEARSLGYLSSGELALLLAAQLSVRANADEQRAVRKELLPNHAALVETGLREFAEDIDALRERLGVPEPAAWPAPMALDELVTLPEESEQEDENDEGGDDDDHTARSESHGGSPIVFRVKRDRSAGGALLGLGASVFLGLAAGAGALAFYGGCALGFVVGAVAGRRVRADECSGCRGRLTEHDQRCASCGGSVAAEIASHEERLDAEERYGAGHGGASVEHDGEEPTPFEVRFAAMFAAWGLSRGLVADDATPAARDLERRVRELDFDTEALHDAWRRGDLLNDEAVDFAEYYWTQGAALWRQDLELLSTANELDARPANYRRFAKLLDHRFEAWRAQTREEP